MVVKTRTEYPINYFYAKVAEDSESDCHLWVGAKYSNNYGHINWQGQNLLAHRVAWEYEHGHPGELQVCHHCDNPACVRIDHLFLGTQKDNLDDMRTKGRTNGPKGSRCVHAKLNEKQVLEIKRRLAAGERVTDLAKEYGVHYTSISHIKAGRWWGWLKAEEEINEEKS